MRVVMGETGCVVGVNFPILPASAFIFSWAHEVLKSIRIGRLHQLTEVQHH